MFKVIIAGGRDFDNYEVLKTWCDSTLRVRDAIGPIEIVSGKARGADKLGEKYAEEKGYPVKEFPANWDKHGKMAGPIRNLEMAKYADGLIAFWDGKSRGTRDMITKAKKERLFLRVVDYNGRLIQ